MDKILTRRDFFSLELLIVGLLFIGEFKKLAFIKNLPFDATLLMLIVTALASIPLLRHWRQILEHSAWVSLAIFAAFIVWICLSFVWSPGHGYALKKMSLMVGLCLPLYVWSVFIISAPQRFYRFVKLVFVFSLLFSLLAFSGFYYKHDMNVYGYYDRIRLFGDDPIGVSRIAALGLMLSGYFLLFVAAKRRSKIIYSLTGLFFGYTTFILDERGPLLAAFVVLAIQWSFYFGRRKGLIRFAPLLILCALFIAMLALHGRGWADIAFRLHLYLGALHLFAHYTWLGGGVGSFPEYVHSVPSANYPHNVILEVAAELGLVGLILFGAVIIRPLYVLCKKYQHMEKPVLVILLSLFLYTFINALISSDLAGNRLFIMTLGFICFPMVKFKGQENEYLDYYGKLLS